MAIENQVADEKEVVDAGEGEVEKKTAMKMLNMPRCAYCVQIATTFLLSLTEARSPPPSSLMLALMNSTARWRRWRPPGSPRR